MEKNEIFKAFGTAYTELTEKLLEAVNLEADIRQKVKKETAGIRIGIKPNLVCPTPASFGATTHPEIIEGILRYLRRYGFSDILILEGSWVGDSTEEAFEYCGYQHLKEDFGVQLIDTKKLPSVKRDGAGMELNICSIVEELDYLINVPVLKGHCQTHMTCALKNMKGLIPDSEKRRFHRLGLHKPIAHLNTLIRPDFIVVDDICGDPDFEEGGNPGNRNCIMVAKDPVLVDVLACKELGWKKQDVPYVIMAEALGIGKTGGEAVHLLDGDEGPVSFDCRRVLEVCYPVDDADTCSACYSALTEALLRLKEENLLESLPSKIGIGQGFRGKTGKTGVGNCTNQFEFHIAGCPPEAEEIYQQLKKLCRKENMTQTG